MIAAPVDRPVMPYWLWPWCLFLFLVPFKQLVPGPVFIGLEIGAAALLALASPVRELVAPVRIAWVCLLVLALCLSAFASIAPDQTAMPLLRVGAAFVTYALATSVALTGWQLRQAMRAWMWGGGATSLLALASYQTGAVGIDGRPFIRLGSYGTDPNFFAAEMLLPLVIALYFLRERPYRAEAIVLLPVLVAGILATQSRGGALAAIAVVVAKLGWERRWILLAFILTSLSAIYFGLATYLGRFGVVDHTGSKRTIIWEILLPPAIAAWHTGIGLDASRNVTRAAAGFYRALEPHNTYLQAFVETGLGGLVCLLAVMWVHGSLRGRDPAILAFRWGILGFAVSAMFLHHLAYQLIWMPWILAVQAAQSRWTEDPAHASGPAADAAGPGVSLVQRRGASQ